MGYEQVTSAEECSAQITLRRHLFSPNLHTVHSMFNRRTEVVG